MTVKFRRTKQSSQLLLISSLLASSALISNVAHAETQSVNANSKNDSSLIQAIGNDPMIVAPSQNVQQSKTGESAIINQINQELISRPTTKTAEGVSSVSQLSDVRPTDWAFTALQSLVERYGCIAGYPDRSFRGKQATSRYEFAAGLNACLDKINEIISAGLADKVSKDDLATLQKLQEEFAAELATLRGRVDALDAKTAKLEAQQFSTTTKLRGEAIFGLVAGSDGTTTTGVDRTNVAFNYRVRLNLDTSFTGKDLLRTRLQASNTNNFSDLGGPLFGNSTRLSYDGIATSANSFEINRLYYKFPVGDSVTAYIAPIGAPEDVLSPLNPLDSDSQGTISRFGRFNPLIRIASNGGSGLAVAGLNFKFSDQANLELAYTASNAATATGSGGVTGGDTKLAAQLVYKPSEALTLGVGYANAYTNPNAARSSTSLNSGLNADIYFDLGLVPSTGGMKSDTVVGSLVWDITKKFTFNTWGSLSFANFSNSGGAASVTYTSWMAALSGKDLFTEGDLAAIIFGQPLFTSRVSGNAIPSSNTPYHLEALYRFPISKNISITPGVFFVFNQSSESINGTAVVGVIRTTFSF